MVTLGHADSALYGPNAAPCGPGAAQGSAVEGGQPDLSGGALGSRGEAGDQLPRVHVQCGGEPEDVHERHVALTPLKAADVGAVEMRPLREHFLA